MRARILYLVVLLLLSGCASAPKPAPVDNIPLAPGDCIALFVHAPSAQKDDDTPQFYIVNASGDVSLPYFSKMHLEGLTLEQAGQRIREAYVPNYFHELIVSVRRCR
jgi:protein involved in polysaccharide export with SLBB domain